MLPETAKIAEFRQQAVRATRESPVTPDQLAEAFCNRFGVATGSADDAKPLSVAQAS